MKHTPVLLSVSDVEVSSREGLHKVLKHGTFRHGGLSPHLAENHRRIAAEVPQQMQQNTGDLTSSTR